MQHNIYYNGHLYEFFNGRVDEFDKPVKRTKQSHPYSYDGFVQWRGGPNEEATSTIYSDRLLQWDYDKHNKLFVLNGKIKIHHCLNISIKYFLQTL